MQKNQPSAAAQTPASDAQNGSPSHPSGWLLPTEDIIRVFLNRPELALVEESCAAEHLLHAALQAAPLRPVSSQELAAVKDADVRESYTLFLRFRDGLLAAGTLEAYYLSLFAKAPKGEAKPINIPPLFIDMVVEAITRHLLLGRGDAGDSVDVYTLRAADMMHQAQRISTQDGQVFAGDQQTLDMLNETGGLGDMGRFLREAKAPVQTINMQVLADGNAPDFLAAWQQKALGQGQQHFLLDLTHEVSNDLSHGLVLTMTRARSGLKALASVLQKWVWHFLGVQVRITPLQKIDDAAWRWHVGLDAEASALLNDLYEGHEVEPARLRRLVSLFRLDFADPLEMRTDVAGKPVYLGLMMTVDGVVKLKPQNLLINLPLRGQV